MHCSSGHCAPFLWSLCTMALITGHCGSSLCDVCAGSSAMVVCTSLDIASAMSANTGDPANSASG